MSCWKGKGNNSIGLLPIRKYSWFIENLVSVAIILSLDPRAKILLASYNYNLARFVLEIALAGNNNNKKREAIVKKI